MAGMPQSIVKRSEQILRQLERDNRQSAVAGRSGEADSDDQIVDPDSGNTTSRVGTSGRKGSPHHASLSRPMGDIANSREGMQLSFFQLDDPVLEQIRDEIKGLDINSLTPLEALNKLNEIKKILN